MIDSELHIIEKILISLYNLCSMKILLIVFVCFANKLNAQCVPKTVSLGNFKTVSGKEIKNCIIGYSTLGKLNAQKNNVVLWPTWFTGKSEEICTQIAPLLMDTAALFIIVVDALGNGISSSPSNHPHSLKSRFGIW